LRSASPAVDPNGIGERSSTDTAVGMATGVHSGRRLQIVRWFVSCLARSPSSRSPRFVSLTATTRVRPTPRANLRPRRHRRPNPRRELGLLLRPRPPDPPHQRSKGAPAAVTQTVARISIAAARCTCAGRPKTRRGTRPCAHVAQNVRLQKDAPSPFTARARRRDAPRAELRRIEFERGRTERTKTGLVPNVGYPQTNDTVDQRRADHRAASHRKTVRPADGELAADAVRQLDVYDLADTVSAVGPPPNLSFAPEVRVDREGGDDRRWCCLNYNSSLSGHRLAGVLAPLPPMEDLLTRGRRLCPTIPCGCERPPASGGSRASLAAGRCDR
jgi:hypothetical protein